MRKCAVWVSATVPQTDVLILDTGSSQGALEFRKLHDRDPMPEDTVLVVVHPAKYQILKDRVRSTPLRFMAFDVLDVNGRAVAAELIDSECSRNPTLKNQLRWEWD